MRRAQSRGMRELFIHTIIMVFCAAGTAAGVFCCGVCGGRDTHAGGSNGQGTWPGRWGWYDR